MNLTRHRHLAAFAPILAVAAFLRLYDLGHGHPGLAIYTSISSHAYKSFHNWMYPSMFADGAILADKPPLFFWYQGLFIALLGQSNIAFRLPVALAGVCSVVLVYAIVRRCSGGAPALIAAAALAVMPLDVNYARSTFIEPVAAAVMLLAAYFVVRAARERREAFYYVAAFVLGLAFMIKLWQGLLPAPAFALIALANRWTPWARLIRVGAICAGIFLITAFWWPLVVWLTPWAYDSVMHADNVWDMIFGWNLRERFGELEYGARHRRDILWFVTGPMSVYFGTSLFPAAAIGVLAVALALWTRGREEAARLLRLLRRRTRTARRAVEAAISVVAPSARRGSAAEAGLRGIEFGFLWVAWLGVAIAGFGGATIRLATYWDVATPAVAALAGLGAASIPSLLRRGAGTVAAVFALALFGVVYAAVAYDRAGDAAEHFGLASNIAFGFAALIAVGGAFMYFGWRPFGIHAGAAALTAAAVGAALLVGSVTVHNLLYPRDDTLGRIGFDQVALSGVGAPEATAPERRRQRQGGIITAIVRADVDRIDAALEYVRQRRGDSRYLLATDTYNTGARVSLLTGEPTLPLYSEYRLVREMDDAELKRLLESGDIPFILTTRDMLYMDFRLYARMIVSSIDATASAGLPPLGEYQLLEVIEGREP